MNKNKLKKAENGQAEMEAFTTLVLELFAQLSQFVEGAFISTFVRTT